MPDELKIECKWLGRQTGSAIDRSFFADIGLAVGEDWLTQLEDFEASTVRNHLRGCAYRLATWFAANWWRLRWEPEIPYWWKDSNWRVAHSIAAVGNGYVWPNVIFATDGSSLAVASLPRSKAAPFEPIRYLNRIRTRITASEFEQKIDSFMEGILSRHESRHIGDGSLKTLWLEVLEERDDSKTSKRRRLEAMAGFDPDEAPAALLKQILDDGDQLGGNAVAEVAAEARQTVSKVLELIKTLATTKGKAKEGGFRVSLPRLNIPPGFADDLQRPWEKGAAFARLARKQWDLSQKPIKNPALVKLLQADRSLFTGPAAGTRIPIGVRKGANGTFDVYFDSPRDTSRRFAMCRMIGDHLFFTHKEMLLPATRAKTARQQFQRAFAQEFLCPIEALREQFPTPPRDEDEISNIAKHFHVSPLLVRTTLVNKGELDREALTWDD